jgi:signal recognition particle GTPase
MGFFDKIKAKVTSVFEAVGFDKLVSGLEKTRAAFVNRLQKVLGGGRKIDAQLLDEVEEILITSDIGVTTSAKIISPACILTKLTCPFKTISSTLTKTSPKYPKFIPSN